MLFQVPLFDDNASEQSKSTWRKRVLPSWMLEKDLLVERISEPVPKGGRFAVVHLHTSIHLCALI